MTSLRLYTRLIKTGKINDGQKVFYHLKFLLTFIIIRPGYISDWRLCDERIPFLYTFPSLTYALILSTCFTTLCERFYNTRTAINVPWESLVVYYSYVQDRGFFSKVIKTSKNSLGPVLCRFILKLLPGLL